MTDAATIVDADPRWPLRYEEVAAGIREAVGGAVDEVHHVGSTSVPGCAAKDCIDVLVLVDAAVPPPEVTRDVIRPLESAGWVHRADLAWFMPERWFLHRDAPFGVNVHVERRGLPGAVRDTRLVVRDALRADPGLRDRYVGLKRSLARSSPDLDAYSEGKSELLLGVIADAAARGDRCGVHLRAEHPGSPAATSLVADYVGHLVRDVPGGFDCAMDAPPPAGSFEPPRGTFLVARDDAEPVACGAMWEVAPGIAELKRMWVAPTHRGLGLGRRLLEALESAARAAGHHTSRLDSMHSLAAAVALYRSAGYSEVPPYNHNPNATIWMERSLR